MQAIAGVVLVMHRARAHPNGARMLWGGVCWVLAGVLLALGIAYLSDGISVASSSAPYEVVIRYMPGGMRGHGAVMILLGLAIVHGLLPDTGQRHMDDQWLHWTVLAVGAYSLWLVIAFAGSWGLNSTPTVAGIVWWLASTALASLLFWLPPPAFDGRGERE